MPTEFTARERAERTISGSMPGSEPRPPSESS